MRKNDSDNIKLSVTANPLSLPWIKAMNQTQRAAQIEASFPSHLGVRVAGIGDRIANNLELIEVTIHFFYYDFHQTCVEFERVGIELGFPHGSRLTHVVKDKQGEYKFTNLLKW